MFERSIEYLHRRTAHLRLGNAGLTRLHIADHALTVGVGLGTELREQIVVEDA